MNKPVFTVLGDWAASNEWESVPQAARRQAKNAIIDFCGVALAAVNEPIATVLQSYVAAGGSSGTSSLMGLGQRTSPEMAAFVNGAMGHALDFDDVNDSMGGHPTAPVFPAALALAESEHLSGEALLHAYCIGFEVEAKIARGVNFVHYDKGWHPTATLGAFGSTAAAAKLLRLSGEETGWALGLAASAAAGLKASFGTMAKPIQVGRAAQIGVASARLAGLGATANPEAFDLPSGFGAVYNGPGLFDATAAIDSIADPWDLIDPGVHLKLYPCCGSTHSAIDAALVARDKLPVGVSDIERVTVKTHPRRLAHTNRPEVSSSLEAKFSVQFAVTMALLGGNVVLDDFTEERRESPLVREMLGRVHAEPLPEDRWGPEHFAAEVLIELRQGGEPIFARYERPRGRSADDPLTQEVIFNKFRECAKASLLQDSSEELLLGLEQLEQESDAARLAALLRGASRGVGVQ